MGLLNLLRKLSKNEAKKDEEERGRFSSGRQETVADMKITATVMDTQTVFTHCLSAQ